MKTFFTKKTFLIFLIALLLTGGIFLLSVLLTTTSTVNDTFGLTRLVGLSNRELLAGQKIQGNFHAQFSDLGIVSVRFTNFGRISTDKVIFRLREESGKTWIYENTYKVDQFQPDKFFTFGFPIQSNSVNKSYFFEIESMSGQKGNAVGLSAYKPSVQFTYAFSKSEFISKPKYTIEMLRYFTVQKFSQTSTSKVFISLLVFIFIIFFILANLTSIMRVVKKNKKSIVFTVDYLKRYSLFSIIFLGLLLRFVLAYYSPHSGDTDAMLRYATLAQRHIFNIYAHTDYPYSPVIFFVAGALGSIRNFLPIFSWPFLWRLFLSLFDLGTVIILIQLARIKKISSTRVAFLFFLNPVSIIISSVHGQFDNIAIFFLLLAIFLHYTTASQKNSKRFLKWVYLTIGILVKHSIVYQLPVFWRTELSKRYQILIVFSLSIAVFLISFLPFWFGTQNQIINNVFLYGGVPGLYGLTHFLQPTTNVVYLDQGDRNLNIITIYKYIFTLSLFAIPFFLKRKEIERNMLFMFLFFLTFTSGIGDQYFVLPIAIGALFQTRWFYLYSIVAGLFVAILSLQLIPYNIFTSTFFSWNTIWIFTSLWFLSELMHVSKTVHKFYLSIFTPSFH